MFFMIWPERRWITSQQVMTWYRDAVANDQVEDVAGDDDVEMMLNQLAWAGLITLGKPPLSASGAGGYADE